MSKIELDFGGSVGKVELIIGLSEMEDLSTECNAHDLQTLGEALTAKKNLRRIIQIACRQSNPDLELEDLNSCRLDNDSIQSGIIHAYLVGDFGPKKAKEFMKTVREFDKSKKS